MMPEMVLYLSAGVWRVINCFLSLNAVDGNEIQTQAADFHKDSVQGSLLDIQRDETGLQFTWQNYNPSKFPLKTHIGIPPVIGEDGIIYGVYETLDIPEVPLTPAEESIEWTTEVPIPQNVSGLYILLSVESKKPRTYVNYALDITDK